MLGCGRIVGSGCGLCISRGRHRPSPDCLPAKMNGMQFRELLPRKRRAEVSIAFANDAD
jgi:hypothetical protein